MKIIKMKSDVDKNGQIVLPAEAVGNAGLKPGDEICYTIMVQEEVNQHCPLVLITSEEVEIAVPLFGLQKDDEKFSPDYELPEDELHIPHELLESANIPLAATWMSLVPRVPFSSFRRISLIICRTNCVGCSRISA